MGAKEWLNANGYHASFAQDKYTEPMEAYACAEVERVAGPLAVALTFAKEIIDDQARRFHQNCRCQLCESAPPIINAALAAYKP